MKGLLVALSAVVVVAGLASASRAQATWGDKTEDKAIWGNSLMIGLVPGMVNPAGAVVADQIIWGNQIIWGTRTQTTPKSNVKKATITANQIIWGN